MLASHTYSFNASTHVPKHNNKKTTITNPSISLEDVELVTWAKHRWSAARRCAANARAWSDRARLVGKGTDTSMGCGTSLDCQGVGGVEGKDGALSGDGSARGWPRRLEKDILLSTSLNPRAVACLDASTDLPVVVVAEAPTTACVAVTPESIAVEICAVGEKCNTLSAKLPLKSRRCEGSGAAAVPPTPLRP